MKKRWINSLIPVVVIIAMVFVAVLMDLSYALAADGFSNPLSGDDGEITTISGLLSVVIKWILGISAFLAMLAIVVSGVRMIMSLGNPSGVEAAKKNLMWAVIGTAVIMLSYAIITLVSGLLGVSL